MAPPVETRRQPAATLHLNLAGDNERSSWPWQHWVAIGYADQTTAEAARQTVQSLEAELIIQADQVAAISRECGRQVPRDHHPRGASASGGAAWGGFLGRALRHALLRPVCSVWRSVREWALCSATWVRRESTRRFRSRYVTTSSQAHPPCSGHREGDAGQGGRCPRAVTAATVIKTSLSDEDTGEAPGGFGRPDKPAGVSS